MRHYRLYYYTILDFNIIGILTPDGGMIYTLLSNSLIAPYTTFVVDIRLVVSASDIRRYGDFI